MRRSQGNLIKRLQMFFNCWVHINNMQEEISSSKGLHNFDFKLGMEEPAFRTVKSCPNCHSIVVTYQKWKGNYRCNNCCQYFKDPVFKQIKDRRKELPVPPTLKKKTYDRASR